MPVADPQPHVQEQATELYDKHNLDGTKSRRRGRRI